MTAMPRLEPLMRITIDVGDIVSLGATPAGERRMVAIQGGRFEADDGWRGAVLSGGADWQWLRADSVLEVDARYVLVDGQGARVQVISQGLRHGPAEVMAALARGESPDPSTYYFRTAMRFESSAVHLLHLNRLLAIGVGERRARQVLLSVFALA